MEPGSLEERVLDCRSRLVGTRWCILVWMYLRIRWLWYLGTARAVLEVIRFSGSPGRCTERDCFDSDDVVVGYLSF